VSLWSAACPRPIVLNTTPRGLGKSLENFFPDKTAVPTDNPVPETMGREQQGRGRGRFNARRGSNGGRGAGGRWTPRGGRTSTNSNQAEMKFAPHVQGKPQSATYATVKDAIVQNVQKNFRDGHDVARSLEELQVIDLAQEEPQREMSKKENPDEKSTDKDGFNIKYQEELRQFMERKNNLRQGMSKAYSLIYSSFCTKVMQSRIEAHPEFEAKIKNDPIALLMVIKTLMHDPVRAHYPMASMTEALTRFLNVKQLENESLMDYVKRFKQLRDVAKSHLGSGLLNKFIEQTEDYQKAEQDKTKEALKDGAFSAWCAYLLIRGSDQSKYGSLTKHFVTQYSLGQDQYPKTIEAATDALSAHKPDAKFHENQKKNRDRQRNEQNDKKDDDTSSVTSFAQKRNVVCYVCGKPGHVKPDCPDVNKIPKSK
jgi:hypothetical protein